MIASATHSLIVLLITVNASLNRMVSDKSSSKHRSLSEWLDVIKRKKLEINPIKNYCVYIQYFVNGPDS